MGASSLWRKASRCLRSSNVVTVAKDRKQITEKETASHSIADVPILEPGNTLNSFPFQSQSALLLAKLSEWVSLPTPDWAQAGFHH